MDFLVTSRSVTKYFLLFIKFDNGASRIFKEILLHRKTINRDKIQPGNSSHYPLLLSNKPIGYTDTRYTDAFPRYPPLRGETPEAYEERALLMSSITSDSIPSTMWSRVQCTEWIYQYLVSRGVENSLAIQEANRHNSTGLTMLIWTRNEFRHLFKVYSDSLYDRVQEVKSGFSDEERQNLAHLSWSIYGGKRWLTSAYHSPSDDFFVCGVSNCKECEEEKAQHPYSD